MELLALGRCLGNWPSSTTVPALQPSRLFVIPRYLYCMMVVFVSIEVDSLCFPPLPGVDTGPKCFSDHHDEHWHNPAVRASQLSQEVSEVIFFENHSVEITCKLTLHNIITSFDMLY